uniref:Tonneau 1-like n=1 Tax=Solanum tuberosum TaxID=4113 RepID=Q38JF8_SOLTU|nr:tonneau 1-like [Solanum tuberosum]ABB02654.1 tonneau 1-like [Solanum tuberosum]
MDDYTREMMDLKTLVIRIPREERPSSPRSELSLEQAFLRRWNEEDRTIEKDESLPPALLGSCNERAKQLHNSPSGRLLNGHLICEYFDWAQFNHLTYKFIYQSVICKRILGNQSLIEFSMQIMDIILTGMGMWPIAFGMFSKDS